VKFNPWRYNDENSLLIQFFEKLSIALDKNIKTGKEKVGDVLKKYAKLLSIDIPIIGNIGDKLENVGDVMGEIDIETLKIRIETIIKESKTKVVIFIDDIDRLDKNEIHTIFRLVKLTGDFSNTTYILSFDEEMVSSAIGERFAAGNQNSGRNFLEKIIQVPLKIPVAQPDALQQFCFKLVDKALYSNKIELIDTDVRRFVNEFSSNILIKLETPRLAVRYGNTLSFSLPLLNGEVNLVDLMLVEAIKIFYPNHYEFIKSNPDFFIGSYIKDFPTGKDIDKVNLLKSHIKKLGEDLTVKQNSCILNLLKELFPRLDQILLDYSYSHGSEDKWFKSKRIASPKYFNRYFTYAVIKGEISDIAFQNFLSEISTLSNEAIISSIKSLIEQSSPENFLYKIRSIEDEFEWEKSTRIAKAISIISEILPLKNDFTFSFGYQAPKGQAAIFIYQLIKKHNNKEEQFKLAKELLNISQPFQFANDINNWLREDDSFENRLFDELQQKKLDLELINRAKKEAGIIPIFEYFPEDVFYLLSSWVKIDKLGLTKYIKGILNKNPEKYIMLLRVFTPTAQSTAVDGTFKIDFSKSDYDFFVTIFDKKYIKEIISKVYSVEDISTVKIEWRTLRQVNYQTDINITRQFLSWYNEDIELK